MTSATASILTDDTFAAAVIRKSGDYQNVACPHCDAAIGSRCYRVQERTSVNRRMEIITTVAFVKTAPHAGRVKAAVAAYREYLQAADEAPGLPGCTLDRAI